MARQGLRIVLLRSHSRQSYSKSGMPLIADNQYPYGFQNTTADGPRVGTAAYGHPQIFFGAIIDDALAPRGTAAPTSQAASAE
jgi:hypothetical protein